MLAGVQKCVAALPNSLAGLPKYLAGVSNLVAALQKYVAGLEKYLAAVEKYVAGVFEQGSSDSRFLAALRKSLFAFTINVLMWKRLVGGR